MMLCVSKHLINTGILSTSTFKDTYVIASSPGLLIDSFIWSFVWLSSAHGASFSQQ